MRPRRGGNWIWFISLLLVCAGLASSTPAPAGAVLSGGPHRAAAAGQLPTMSFHSRRFHPPRLTLTSDPDRSSGDILIAPTDCCGAESGSQHGPMILSGRGQLVWFRPLPAAEMATNLEVQRYGGQPVLTWWQGNSRNGSGGEDVIASSSYRTIAILRGAGGRIPDMHEFQITPQGTALYDCFVPVPADLRSVGGPKHGHLWDSSIQEVNIRTGKLLWDWHAYDHVPLKDTYASVTPRGYLDFFHLNSIQPLPDGNLLISARNTWSVYELSRRTGRIIWSLGGKHSSFRMGGATKFEWQHDAHLSGQTLSLLDDADSPQEESQSSAKVLKLNMTSRPWTSRLVRSYRHSPPVLTPYQGSAEMLPNGNMFVGWGSDPQFSEFAPDGRQIFNGVLPLGLNSYRAYRFPWIGRPADRPAVALSAAPRGRMNLYVSWNGATTVAYWRVLGGGSPSRLTPVRRARRRGFETRVQLERHRYLEVEALDSSGRVLRSTRPMPG